MPDDPQTPLVYILILNWNSYRETIECVKACQRLSYSNFRILILDNGSRDDSEKQLSISFPEIELIPTGANLGYAAGNNIGIRRALSKRATYIWIINPDVLVEDYTLTKMIHIMMDNPSIGICGPRVINGGKPWRFAFDGLCIEPDNGYQWHYNAVDFLSEENQPVIVDVDCVSGCSMLIRSDLIYAIGLLSENFFLYYEDVELSFRARDQGWLTVVYTGCLVKHDHDIQVKPLSTGFRVERSRIIFAKLRNSCIRKILITRQSLDLFILYLKQMQLFKAFRFLIEVLLGILCGLVSTEKPLPVAHASTKIL